MFYFMKLTISDEDGFIAIVNNERYQTFVDEDWQFEQLIEHFKKQIQQQHLILWQTNEWGGGVWNIEVIQDVNLLEGQHQFKQLIQVSNQKLYLSNYTDLTMAAQFVDERIPSKDNQQLFVELANGLYQVTVSNLFEKDDADSVEEFDEDAIHFQICIAPYSGDLSVEQTAMIHWFEEEI